MEWSKGVIFFMATFWPEGLCNAELQRPSVSLPSAIHCGRYEYTPNHSVRSFPNHILNIILIRNVEGYLSRPIWWRSLLTSHFWNLQSQ